ncbi:DUF1780 domain-containing protein [Dyella tabacisoli]|uniref:Uncharacterized protein n=1 Tax=Dyella tabacisoli TaxID=2282381 RepID=A0A369UMZ2_9GAMM|nr:DUF1780 domain-containing protein [Dyella tabacisoli]RDD81901.1 hypothetical protein DVJ77_08890 [Dyella tabacisoli]
MDDKEFIDQRVKDLEESVRSFSSKNKKEGERWVVISFIENLRIPLQPQEVISPDQDPPDVVFRDACFEVKEIMDEERKRHAEYKAELERVRKITDPKDLLRPFRPKTMTLEEIYLCCDERVKSLDKKYPTAVKAATDLLFYVNLVDVTTLVEQPYPDVSSMATAGWRSISFLKGQRSCCFYADSTAPAFLRKVVGRVWHLHPGRESSLGK